MPIKSSALRALRKDRKRHQRNLGIQSELKTLSKQLVTLIKEDKLDEASKAIRLVAKKYDRAASRGKIHPNTAARKKSRLTRSLNKRLANASA